MADSSTKALAELEHIEEDALYSAKGHFEAAAGMHKLYVSLGLPVALISGVAGVSAFSSFTKHDVVAGVLALVAAGLGAVNTFLGPSGKSAVHSGFGNDYNSLRNRARLCREVQAAALSDAQLTEQILSLASERDDLNKKAPLIPRRAFERARSGIEAGEATYATDGEQRD
jgi:hypothetical protein